MKFRIYFCSLLVGIVVLAGCTRSFDSPGYLTAMLNTLYKGNYTAYAEFTGISTAEASQYRDQWLTIAAENFITAMGAGTPSDSMCQRTTEFLKKLYANARYDLSVNEDSSILLTLYPMDLIVKNFPALQSYVSDFNAKNNAFAFASLTEQEFNDTYLDGILTLLESRLTELTYSDPVELTVIISQDEAGLYTISPETLAAIQKNVLLWPDIPSHAETEKES